MQLEEKSRKIRALEESLKEMEGKLYESTKEADNLGNQVKHLKTLINENVTNAREEVRFSIYATVEICRGNT